MVKKILIGLLVLGVLVQSVRATTMAEDIVPVNRKRGIGDVVTQIQEYQVNPAKKYQLGDIVAGFFRRLDHVRIDDDNDSDSGDESSTSHLALGENVDDDNDFDLGEIAFLFNRTSLSAAGYSQGDVPANTPVVDELAALFNSALDLRARSSSPIVHERVGLRRKSH